MISCLDERLPSSYVNGSFDQIVCFMIGDLQYQWDTLRNTLSIKQPDPEPAASEIGLFAVHLYTSFEEAKALVDLLQSGSLAAPSTPSFISPPLTTDRTPSLHDLTDGSPISAGAPLFDVSTGIGYFGVSPNPEDIDSWVDGAVMNRTATHDGTKLKCPEPGCNASCRRPHALKARSFMC
ncbi:hypothetical protein OPQ81_008009 [Rhizoctonia solani]|nr:hypothetical protein OPQ81_008009 [Rhizoctonia solani]